MRHAPGLSCSWRQREGTEGPFVSSPRAVVACAGAPLQRKDLPCSPGPWGKGPQGGKLPVTGPECFSPPDPGDTLLERVSALSSGLMRGSDSRPTETNACFGEIVPSQVTVPVLPPIHSFISFTERLLCATQCSECTFETKMNRAGGAPLLLQLSVRS